jgi:CheY-like chemotaxis protein
MINNYKILVNEDDSSLRDIYSFYLFDFKDVVIVSSGEEAIQECKLNLFNLVITDIKSSNRMNGIDALKEIRKIEG